MADDIDVLGQSLLNRQRTNRKRSQKQNRKERNINLGLNLAAKGVGYANTYLKNRADTFVNEQEELVGSRLRQQKAIARSQSIIEDYTKAQEYATGPEGYLAQEKFAPIIRANFERDFGATTTSSKTDINNWVYETAATQAKESIGSFNSAYDAAMSMGDIENYDAYIKTRDGRAENVGGFLFNKLTRSLNNKTQADIDQEVVASMRTNRFTDRADRVLLFDGYLNAGYAQVDALNLAKKVDTEPSNTTKSVLNEMGIGEADIILSGLTPTEMKYYRKGEPLSIYVNRADYTQNGVLVNSLIMPIKNSNNQIVDEEGFNFFMGEHNNNPQNNNSVATNTITSEELVDQEFLAKKLDPDNADGWYATKKVKVKDLKSDDGYERPGSVYAISYFNNNSRSPNPLVQHTEYITEYDNPVGPTTSLGETASLLTTSALTQIESVLIPQGEEENLQQLKLVDMMFFTDADELDDALDDYPAETKATLAKSRDAITYRVWGESQKIMEASINPNNSEDRFSQEDATLLATAAAVVPYMLAYENEQIHPSRLISPEKSRNVTLLIAETQLSENTPLAWNSTPPAYYNKLVIGSLDDIITASGEEGYKDSPYASLLVNQLREIKGYQKIVVPATAFTNEELLENIKNSGRPLNDKGEFSLEQLVSYAAQEPVQKIETPVNEEINNTTPNPSAGTSYKNSETGGAIPISERLMVLPVEIGNRIKDSIRAISSNMPSPLATDKQVAISLIMDEANVNRQEAIEMYNNLENEIVEER